MTASIVIATYNRAHELRDTLDSLRQLRARVPWEVIVVDNNSTDDTRGVVEQAAAGFPVPLRYLFERVQGRSAALNTGIAAATGRIVLTTDDDVRVPPDWIDVAARALEEYNCDYVGGRVLPIWRGARPDWLSDRPGPHWAVIALLDYGRSPVELLTRMPLGVNMAFRRDAFDRVGGWDPRIGRKAGTLLGQEVREWCIRARAAGVRGFYAPAMAVEHVIPADRLQKRYFRRWFYWRGVSRALLYQQQGLDMESPQETRLDFSRVAHIAGTPRYLYRIALNHLLGLIRSTFGGDAVRAFEHELWLCMFAGILRQRWRDRRQPFEWRGGQPAPAPPPSRMPHAPV